MFIILMFVFLTLCPSCYSFASWMAIEYCDRPLRRGEIIMGREAKFSENRIISISRNGHQLENGDIFFPGEALSVVLTGEDVGEMVLEASVGLFEFGGCGNKRTTLNHANMIMPTDTEIQFVTINAGWAIGHDTVWITEPFTLIRE